MLKDKLREDLKESLKSGDAARRILIGVILSAIKNREFEKRSKLSRTESDISKLETESQLNDEEVIGVISSEIKKRKEAAESYEKGGRPELAENEKKEMEILMNYMPEQMSEEEIKLEIKKTIKESGVVSQKDAGKITGLVMARVKGQADGQLVSKLVRELLSQPL